MERAEVPLEVDADDVVPLLLGHVDEHAVPQDAGVVHQHVDVAEGVDGSLDQALGTAEVGDVVGVGDGLAAHGLDLLDHVMSRPGIRSRSVLRPSEVVDHDLGALTSEQQGVLPTDAAPPPL